MNFDHTPMVFDHFPLIPTTPHLTLAQATTKALLR